MDIEELLQMARGVAEQAEGYYWEGDELPVAFEANRLKMLESRRSRGVALRIVRHGRIGHAPATDRADPASLVAMAAEVAPFGAQARFELPGPASYPEVAVFDPEVAAVSVDSMIELGQSLIDRVRSRAPELLCDASVTRYIGTLTILNSSGAQATSRKSVFSAGVEGQLTRGTDMLFVGEHDSSCRLALDVERIVGETLLQLDRARETASIASGNYPVVFTPAGVRSALVGPLAAGFNGKRVLQGASPLGPRLGEEIVDRRISLWDDATIPLRPGSRMCDDEAVASQRTPLFQAGVVMGFLYDLQTAGEAGTRSTGNGSRSGGGLPGPSTSALLLEEGDTTFEEMIADIRGEGVVVEHLMGAGQGNVLGGDFSGNVLLGYKVEAGQIVGRLKDTVVAGNVYAALRELAAVGRPARWVGGLRCPPLYCRSLSVASRG